MRPRRRFAGTWPARVALVVVVAVLVVAFFGPLFAPHSPSETLGPAFSGGSSGSPLGTDYAGEDVLSRVLNGGLSLLALALAST